MASAKNVNDVTPEAFAKDNFPEWGSYLNETIANKQVPEGSFATWWLGCMGFWLKTHEGTNIVVDMWNGTGKHTHGDGKMRKGHQMMRMAGDEAQQPNLRNRPYVIDPFSVKDVDALCVTHTHHDHLDIYTAACVNKNCPNAKFIGPQGVVDEWLSWGIPEEKTIVVKPGDEVKVGAVTIKALESFDRTELVTEDDPNVKLAGTMPKDMSKIAVNYLFETSGGNLYDAGDSHFSNTFVKHGNENKIDVAFCAYGENPRGITDKLDDSQVLRMAEDLNTKVVIPMHWDIWSNFFTDPKDIIALWDRKKYRLQYKFKPYILQVGGEFNYPQDKDKFEYMYDRGFHDAFKNSPDLPFPELL